MLGFFRRIPSVFFILAVIVCLTLLLRFASYDHPLGFHGGDGMSDYLVASHALNFGEWPVTGPGNGVIPPLGNSPLYYYIVIAFAAIHATAGFVNVCFILLGVLSVIGVFEITRRLFGNVAAVIAAALFAFSPLFIKQYSYFIWQPYLMEPVLILGVFLFVKGFQEASSKFLMLSLIAVLCAFAIHMSVGGFLPLYLILLSLVLFRIGGMRALIIQVLVGAGTCIVLFVVPSALSHAAYVPYVGETFFPGLPALLDPHRFGTILSEAMQILQYRLSIFSTPFLDAILLLLALVYFVKRDVHTEKKLYLAVLLLFLVEQCLAASFLGVGNEDRHAVPANWALVAATAAIFYETLFRSRYTALFGVALCAAIVMQITKTPFIQSAIHNMPKFERPREEAFGRAVLAMETNIENLRTKNGFADYSFFDVVGFRTGNLRIMPDAFYERFEPYFKTRFSHFSSSIREKTDARYVFIVCTKGMEVFSYTKEECLDYFARQFPAYAPAEPVFIDPILSVSLAERAGGAH